MGAAKTDDVSFSESTKKYRRTKVPKMLLKQDDRVYQSGIVKYFKIFFKKCSSQCVLPPLEQQGAPRGESALLVDQLPHGSEAFTKTEVTPPSYPQAQRFGLRYQPFRSQCSGTELQHLRQSTSARHYIGRILSFLFAQPQSTNASGIWKDRNTREVKIQTTPDMLNMPREILPTRLERESGRPPRNRTQQDRTICPYVSPREFHPQEPPRVRISDSEWRNHSHSNPLQPRNPSYSKPIRD